MTAIRQDEALLQQAGTTNTDMLKAELDDAKARLANQTMHNELKAIRSKLDRQGGRKSALANGSQATALRPKEAARDFMGTLLARLMGMFSLRPITGHIIAIAILVLAFSVGAHKLPQTFLIQYGVYLNWLIGISVGIVVIKSAAYSLTMPVIALVVGATSTAIAHHFHGTMFTLDASFYIRILVVGLIGLLIAAMTIE